jgi:hypothetical protein
MRLLINVGILLLFISTSHAYDVVLKNGKSIHGKKVSEDENQIVVVDATGVRINVKKTNIDSAKTEAANQQTTTSETPKPAATNTASKPAATQKSAAPKKPARVVTKEELEKLKEKYDLGEGTFGEHSKDDSEKVDENSIDTSTQKTEAEWREEAEMHRQKLEQAQEQYNRLNEECAKLKQLTVQNNILVDEQGNELPMQDTTKEVCDLADSAHEKLDVARESYSDFTTEAKQQAVPPGWLRDSEGNDPPEQ